MPPETTLGSAQAVTATSRWRSVLHQESVITLLAAVLVGVVVLLPLITMVVSSFRVLDDMGFDTRWGPEFDDETLAAVGQAEHRILLTRDRGLLKRAKVTHGLFVRSERPVDQVVDVLRRLDLGDRLAPFTRCLRCGGELATVAKEEVLDRLEPLTREHYDDFQRCVACRHIYWRGSHHEDLRRLVDRIRAALASPPSPRQP